MKKLIIFQNIIETQQFFLHEIAKTFETLGYSVLCMDAKKPQKSISAFLNFHIPGETLAISFNFQGMLAEDLSGHNLWSHYDIPFINIVVDHPLFYYDMLNAVPSRYIQISIDHNHEVFMQRFFSDIQLGGFLPLGGTALAKPNCAAFYEITERPVDLIFCGNYTCEEKMRSYIKSMDSDSQNFYEEMIEYLLTHPSLTVEACAEQFLKRDIPEITEAEIKQMMPYMMYVDMSVRNRMRSAIIKTITDSDAGLQIHVVGKGWDTLTVRHPENLIIEPFTNSLTCLELISKAKISVNIMPWFKAGAHDRIFNSMLNGAVCLTDSSSYLDTVLKSGENAMLYSLKEIQSLPELIASLTPEMCIKISQAGLMSAMESHTWESRANQLHKQLMSLLI